jgi:uncharacterized protein with beta-barrel porin domain
LVNSIGGGGSKGARAMRERIDNDMTVSSTPGGWPGLLRTVLTTSGPVALLAMLLAAFLGYAVWGRLDRIEASQSVMLNEMTTARVAMTAFSQLHGEIEAQRSILLRSQIGLLRQLCVNSARTEAQVAKCLAE